jgi:site-specific DNA recombinase
MTTNGHKRAVLYARVSTDEQAETGYGLLGQLTECRKYAERMNFEIVQEFQEEYTGKVALTERPEGKKMMALVTDTRQHIDAVIVHRVDRIARDSFFARLAVRDWLQHGLDVHTCDIGRIDDDNGIVFTIMNWQGNDDYKKIIANTTRGRNIKASLGKVVGTARPPYGYHFVKDANGKTIGLEIYEPEARIVRLIFEWYVEGDEHGRRLTLMSIGIRLSEMGILAPRQNLKRRVSANTVWLQSTIQKIIANETYCGVWHYRKTERHGSKLQYRDPSERIAVKVPAIIDRELWERAQARRKYNAALSRRNGKREYLLRGRIRCKCGKLMYGRAYAGAKNSELRSYVCNSRGWGVQTREKKCFQKQIRCERIDTIVWESIKGLFADLDRLWDDLRAAQQGELDAQDPKRAELQAIEDFIAQADREADEIALAMRQAKGRVAESLQRQQDDLNARLEGYHKRRGELVAELGARRLTDDAIQDIMTFARDVRIGIDEADFETKRRVIELLDVQVSADDDKVQVSCVIPNTTS